MTCDCPDWKSNIEKVEAPLMLQAARSGFNPNVGYHGVRFRYCPWCSEPLRERSVKTEEDIIEEELIREGFHRSTPEEIERYGKFVT